VPAPQSPRDSRPVADGRGGPDEGWDRVDTWRGVHPPPIAVQDRGRPRRPGSLIAVHRAVHRLEALPNVGSDTCQSRIRHPGPRGQPVTRIAARLLERSIADHQRTLTAWLDRQEARP
jgi:hypothetical protein